MKKLPSFLFLLLIAAVTAAQAPQQLVPLESYIDPKSNTIVNYPRTWKLDNKEHLWMNYTLFAPQGPEAIYPSNFTLTHQHITDPGVTAEKIGKMNEGRLQYVADKVKLVSSKAVSLNGFDTWMLEYTGELLKDGVGVKLRWRQHYFLEKDNLYTLTFICQESSSKELWPAGMAIFDSFKKVSN